LGRSAKCARWRGSADPQSRRRANAGAGHSDSTRKHCYSARSFRHASGRHGDSDCRHRDSEHRIDCARFQLDESGYPWQQHPTFYGKSEYVEYTGNESERFSMRNIAGHGWDNGLFDTERGVIQLRLVSFGVIQFWFVALYSRKQPGKFGGRLA
jgi:hypothetical protein